MDDYRVKLYAQYGVHTSISGQSPDKYSYEQWAHAARWYVRGWLPEDKSIPILDLGCGAGYFLWLVQDLGYTSLVGVDLSPGQVGLAQQACPTARIILGDAQEMLAQFPSHYGLITGFDLIEHLCKNELLSLLELVYRALCPGGRVIFQTPNAESPWGMNVRYGDLTHQLAVSPRGLHSLLSFSGLIDYEARECGPYPHGFVSAMRYLLWHVLHAGLGFWNLVETGGKGSGVYTRVFVATALKP
ncbi:MAG: class I SAM-dependent methyltransferase [Dehalococcoidia bacterium]|jgi:SAM-dependent methyltransferase